MEYPTIALSRGQIPGGTHSIDHLQNKIPKEQRCHRVGVESKHMVAEQNLQRIVTDPLWDRDVTSVSIPDTKFSFFDAIDVREEIAIKNFSAGHLFPNDEYLLGVIISLIEMQPSPSDPGYLIKRNRFYFWHRQERPGLIDVIESNRYPGKWMLCSGHACSYNNINFTSRLFSAES